MSPNVRRIVGWSGLSLIIALNLLTLFFVGEQIYSSFRTLPLIVHDAGGLQQIFESYKDRVDGAQKLVTLLIGLSSLYALSMAFTTFLSAQQYLQILKDNAGASAAQIAIARKSFDAEIAETERLLKGAQDTVTAAQESNSEANAQVERLRKEFPTFDRMTEAIQNMISRLQALLPDTEWIDLYYRQMTPQQHEEVLLYERSCALFEVLNPAVSDPNTLDLYLRLSKYYRAKHFAQPASSAQMQFPNSLERAKFYIRKYAPSGENFVSLTERGIIAYKQGGAPNVRTARESFALSIDREPNQQRARYWLSILQHQAKEYAEAETSLNAALSELHWERQLSTRDRRNDILYNRSCARSRLAQQSTDLNEQSRFLAIALQDLEDSCPGPDQRSL